MSEEKTETKVKTPEKEAVERLAIIRIRGQTGIKKQIKDTMEILRLHRKNCCVVIDANPNTLGMVKKVKDYVTWGEIDNETFKLLVEKRGKEYKGRTQDSKGKIQYNKFIEVDNKKLKPFFRLHPPKGGFERKGTKIPFKLGGALGARDQKINDLIKRML